MHSPSPLLFLVILAFVIPVVASDQITCQGDILPSAAKSLLNKTFPAWRIKRPSDLVAYDLELWGKVHPKECPGIAVGHFESPNQTGYGLLLIQKTGAETGYKIVVLIKSTTANCYSLRVLDHAEGQAGTGSGLVISKVPSGKYSGFDSTQSIKVRLDAVEAEWLEKSSVLYFWKNGKYRTLQTSD